MTSEWPYAKLGDLTINLDARRKPVKEADRKPGPYPYYGASGIVDYVDGFIFDGQHLLIAEDGENLRTRNTPIAFLANGKFWVNNHAHIVIGNARASTRFLLYALLGTDISAYLSGAVMPKLTQGNLNRIELPCPPIPHQASIENILGALDDRIALLCETNKTLESIVQAIFKSWFVDFDPVRSKMEGRPPEGMDEETGTLFPHSFEESGVETKPQGWRSGTLSAIMKLHKGSVNPGAAPSVEFRHFSLPAYDAGQLPTIELGQAIKSNKTEVPENAVLLSKLNPHIPRVWLPSVVKDHSVCSTEFLPFVPQNGSTTAFIYAWLSSPSFTARIQGLVTGTSNSHQRIKPDNILSMEAILPPASVIERFDCIVNGLFERVKANRITGKTLADLRDHLLPRLISGQLRLPEAQEQVENALS